MQPLYSQEGDSEVGIQPTGPKEGKLRPQQSAAPALVPGALDLTPEFPGQHSSDLEGGAACVPPAKCSHRGGALAHPVPGLGGEG